MSAPISPFEVARRPNEGDPGSLPGWGTHARPRRAYQGLIARLTGKEEVDLRLGRLEKPQSDGDVDLSEPSI